MATFLYNNARQLFATAGLNWPTAPINAMLVDKTYAANIVADQYVAAIPPGAIIVRDIALTNLAAVNGVCSGLIPQFNAFANIDTVAAVVLYSKLSDDAVSPLIYYSGDGVGFPFQPTGFNYYVTFPQAAAGWFQV